MKTGRRGRLSLRVPLIGSGGFEPPRMKIVGSRRCYRRPQPRKEFVVGCAAVIETSTQPDPADPCRAMLIGGDDFHFRADPSRLLEYAQKFISDNGWK